MSPGMRKLANPGTERQTLSTDRFSFVIERVKA
jgi:hypothetical protein